MKVIFLDVDGVLNFMKTEARAPSGCLGVATPPVKQLRDVVKATGAFIVLTSTWKDEWDFDDEKCSPDGLYLVRKLKREGLHILDKTRDQISDRGHGIQEWLSRHPEVDHWVVLDDDIFVDYEECGIMPHLVETSLGGDGLNAECAAKAIQILNEGVAHA